VDHEGTVVQGHAAGELRRATDPDLFD